MVLVVLLSFGRSDFVLTEIEYLIHRYRVLSRSEAVVELEMDGFSLSNTNMFILQAGIHESTVRSPPVRML
jgi:hypothetical protein